MINFLKALNEGPNSITISFKDVSRITQGNQDPHDNNSKSIWMDIKTGIPVLTVWHNWISYSRLIIGKENK